MDHCSILFIVFLIYFAHNAVVFAKPSYNFSLPLSVNTLHYSNELNSEYHIKNGIEFVRKQWLDHVKSAAINTGGLLYFIYKTMSIQTM